MSPEKYVHAAVIQPLGMTRTDYRLTKEILAQASDAHDLLGDKTHYVRFTASAAAGLQTTVHDLALFASAAMAGSKGEAPGRGVLKPETLATMMEPGMDGKAHSGLGYFTPKGEVRLRGHGGDNHGWHAVFEAAVDQGRGIVILTNADGARGVRDRILCQWKQAIGVGGERGCRSYSHGLIISQIKAKGTGQFASWYRETKEKLSGQYIFHEMILNMVGIAYLEKGQLDEGLAILKLATEEYPDSFNTWDSLGFAYVKLGKTGLAIENYRKSVEMNPDNTEGKLQLKELLKKQGE